MKGTLLFVSLNIEVGYCLLVELDYPTAVCDGDAIRSLLSRKTLSKEVLWFSEQKFKSQSFFVEADIPGFTGK